jgi:hypothetical protein
LALRSFLAELDSLKVFDVKVGSDWLNGVNDLILIKNFGSISNYLDFFKLTPF